MRSDIQALRGLAVLLVLVTHAKLGLSAGYLGVDIFFVISGYLITGMVDRAVQAGRFSFRTFYFRRAKRLLPAAYTVFVATAFAGFFLLNNFERVAFSHQMVGAVTFTANFVMFRQTNYFAVAADFKPLLHVWSLSIEEQYYLVVPALVAFTPHRYRAVGAWAILAISLGFCFWKVQTSPTDAFYLVQYRVWELAIGSVGALTLDKPDARWAPVVRWLFWPSVVALLAVPTFPIDPLHHPGIDALIVCVATLIVILRFHKGFSASLPVRGIAWVGDFSYSLYLVHWPILAFAHTIYLSGGHSRIGAFELRGTRVGTRLCALSLRRISRPHRRLCADAAAGGGDDRDVRAGGRAACHSLRRAWRGRRDYAHLRRLNLGLSKDCDFTTGPLTPRAVCRTSDRPRMLVWGDSFAQHLVPGIEASNVVGFEQVTSSACGPFVGLALERVGPKCLAFNASVMAHVEASSSIEAVVLASPFGPYLSGAPLILGDSGNFKTVPTTSEFVFEMLKATVDRLHAAKKRVVLVKPPPGDIGFDVGACQERRAAGRITLGAPERCEIDQEKNELYHRAVFELLDKVSAATGAPVFSLDSFLCSNNRCSAGRDGVLFYRDASHLAVEGSRWIGEQIGLGDRLMEMAR